MGWTWMACSLSRSWGASSCLIIIIILCIYNICIPYTVYLLKSYHCCYLLLSMFQLSLLYSWVSSGKSHDYSHYECIIIGYVYYTLVDRSSPHCSDLFKASNRWKHLETCAPRQFLRKWASSLENHHGKVVARQSTSFKLLRMGSRYAVVLSVVPWGCIMLSLTFLHKIVLEDSHPAFTKGIHIGLSSHYWYYPCTQKSLVRCNIRIVFTVAPIESYWHSLNLSSVKIFGVNVANVLHPKPHHSIHWFIITIPTQKVKKMRYPKLVGYKLFP